MRHVGEIRSAKNTQQVVLRALQFAKSEPKGAPALPLEPVDLLNLTKALFFPLQGRSTCGASARRPRSTSTRA